MRIKFVLHLVPYRDRHEIAAPHNIRPSKAGRVVGARASGARPDRPRRSAKSIGLILNISPRTVSVHSASIVRTLGADNRLQAVAMAVRGGLLAPEG